MTRLALLESALVGPLVGAACAMALPMAVEGINEDDLSLDGGSWWTVAACSAVAAALSWLIARTCFLRDAAIPPGAAALAGVISGSIGAAAVLIAFPFIAGDVQGHYSFVSRRLTSRFVVMVGLIAGCFAGTLAGWLGRTLTGRQLDW
jgi:hypothetical protein